MSRPGPKPVPTHLRILRGETRPSRLNAREPLPRPQLPKPASWLSKEAKAEWRRIVKELPAGVLTAADRQCLTVACQAWDRWVQATKLVNTFGIMTRGDRGLVKANYIQIARDAEATLTRCWAALGLSPADRSRIELPERDDADVARRYFG